MQVRRSEVAAGPLASAAVCLAVAASLGGWEAKATEIGAPPAMTVVQPGLVAYPVPGEFLSDGRPAPAPRQLLRFDTPLEIMTYQVSSAEYARCVAARRCRSAAERPGTPADAPVTGVSYRDATDYVRWYSEATGESWRLPSDAEWAFAAAERFAGEEDPIEIDPANPARKWLSAYTIEAERNRVPDPTPRVRGSFGANSQGLFDVAGNVWEWTTTCYVRTTLAADGSAQSAIENCGVHVLGGLHRAYMSDFVSDGKSGGCAVGTPPDNLGFRMVRDQPGVMKSLLRRLGIS